MAVLTTLLNRVALPISAPVGCFFFFFVRFALIFALGTAVHAVAVRRSRFRSSLGRRLKKSGWRVRGQQCRLGNHY